MNMNYANANKISHLFYNTNTYLRATLIYKIDRIKDLHSAYFNENSSPHNSFNVPFLLL